MEKQNWKEDKTEVEMSEGNRKGRGKGGGKER